tara:strand:+ start:173 stop:808 length:636 start_codon:yes stop_codon:yes gene_type:complete
MVSHIIPVLDNLAELAYLPSQNPLKSHKNWAGRFWQPNPGLAGTERIGALGIVDLFLSTFEHRIDKKGRLSVPAPFRSVLERRSDPLYLFKSLTEPCLEGCGPERIGQIVDAIDTMDSLSAEVATLQTMLSSAQEMKLDSEGRIMLNTDFIAFAKLNESALYAGIGRSFQIWLPSRYRTREADARDRAKTNGLPSLRLSQANRISSGNGDR